MRRKELIALAAEKKAEEDRQATLNALIAGRWIQPEKSWVNELLRPPGRTAFAPPEMSEEQAIERAWKIIAADRKEREKEKKG